MILSIVQLQQIEQYKQKGLYLLGDYLTLNRKNKRAYSVSRKTPEFVIENLKGMPDYNGLRDPHLSYHFYNKKLRKHLRKNGLVRI